MYDIINYSFVHYQYFFLPIYSNFIIYSYQIFLMNPHTDQFFLNLYRNNFYNTSKDEMVQNRNNLFNIINGDIFYPMTSWPIQFRLKFWSKPISDKDTFELFLFFLGNGGSPSITGEWILTSQAWTDQHTGEKRARQLDFILTNREAKAHHWFYFDLFHNDWRFLNGIKRQSN